MKADRKHHNSPERRALRNRRRATRHLRHERNSLHLNNIADIRRLQKFLKAAKFAGWGAIIIDAGLAAQKVNAAGQTGGNAGRIAYEEYAALVGGIAAGAAVSVGVLTFFGPGLLVLTIAGGISALAGAEVGRILGRLIHDQIASYESALPAKRKKQILSEAALSAL